ncbi:MAG: TetR/AcrR family transcriptional regulator [Actinobacteria bacterium]|nr:TetR/AcrR family transcriptional regulator [Actinomycetota bacterium]
MSSRVARGSRERSTPSPPTRERILFEASNLFARQGYRATTTRRIAEAVGIKQPSLFHHFPSKSAIAEALLSWDIDQALPYVEGLAAAEGPAAVRLYHYLRHDLAHLANSPYNLTGLYGEDVLSDPAFSRWVRKRERLHGAVERIVRDGVASGEFVKIRSELVSEAIAGITLRVLSLYSGGRRPTDELADETASLVLRGLLANPSHLSKVRERAYRWATLESAGES